MKLKQFLFAIAAAALIAPNVARSVTGSADEYMRSAAPSKASFDTTIVGSATFPDSIVIRFRDVCDWISWEAWDAGSATAYPCTVRAYTDANLLPPKGFNPWLAPLKWEPVDTATVQVGPYAGQNYNLSGYGGPSEAWIITPKNGGYSYTERWSGCVVKLGADVIFHIRAGKKR